MNTSASSVAGSGSSGQSSGGQKRTHAQADPTNGQAGEDVTQNSVAKEWGEWHPSRFDDQKRLLIEETGESLYEQKNRMQQLVKSRKIEENEEWKKRTIEGESDKWREETEERQRKIEEEQNRLLAGLKSEPDCAHPNFPVMIVEEEDRLYSVTSVDEYNDHLEQKGEEEEEEDLDSRHDNPESDTSLESSSDSDSDEEYRAERVHQIMEARLQRMMNRLPDGPEGNGLREAFEGVAARARNAYRLARAARQEQDRPDFSSDDDSDSDDEDDSDSDDSDDEEDEHAVGARGIAHIREIEPIRERNRHVPNEGGPNLVEMLDRYFEFLPEVEAADIPVVDLEAEERDIPAPVRDAHEVEREALEHFPLILPDNQDINYFRWRQDDMVNWIQKIHDREGTQEGEEGWVDRLCQYIQRVYIGGTFLNYCLVMREPLRQRLTELTSNRLCIALKGYVERVVHG